MMTRMGRRIDPLPSSSDMNFLFDWLPVEHKCEVFRILGIDGPLQDNDEKQQDPRQQFEHRARKRQDRKDRAASLSRLRGIRHIFLERQAEIETLKDAAESSRYDGYLGPEYMRWQESQFQRFWERQVQERSDAIRRSWPHFLKCAQDRYAGSRPEKRATAAQQAQDEVIGTVKSGNEMYFCCHKQIVESLSDLMKAGPTVKREIADLENMIAARQMWFDDYFVESAILDSEIDELKLPDERMMGFIDDRPETWIRERFYNSAMKEKDGDSVEENRSDAEASYGMETCKLEVIDT